MTGASSHHRILVVAMPNSVHTQRWLSMVADRDLTVLLLPVYDHPPVGGDWVRPISVRDVSASLPAGCYMLDPAQISSRWSDIVDRRHRYTAWQHSFLDARMASPQVLGKLIRRFDPHLVHAMEIQLAGYLCQETARRMKTAFPPWLLSNWGSDLFLFRKLQAHRQRIISICGRIDFYLAECERDLPIARGLGYRGPTLKPLPVSGGMDFETGPLAMPTDRPSRRRRIMIKGYHGWSGRALTSLSALRLVADRLRDFEIVVPLYNDAVRRECAALTRDFGLGIRLLDYAVDHADFLAELAACRVLVSIGISDGVATTALEALSLGVLPIQSDTACIGEWVTHGRTGFIVSPYDTRAIADALLTAATDDALVDAAAPINRETVRKRWNRHTNGVAARKIYRDCIEAEPVHV